MKEFTEYLQSREEKLDLYTKAITRAHGENHPEVFEVRDLYLDLNQKLKQNDENVSDEVENLRQVTNNYHIPSDVCETFEATYHMLEKADSLYQATV